MDNRDKQSPETGRQADSDISKQQGSQQPEAAKGSDWKQSDTRDPLTGEQGQAATGQADSGQADTGQADYGSAEGSDTLTGERSDIEGASLSQPETGEADGFIGTEVSSDATSELIEDDKNIPSDGE